MAKDITTLQDLSEKEDEDNSSISDVMEIDELDDGSECLSEASQPNDDDNDEEEGDEEDDEDEDDNDEEDDDNSEEFTGRRNRVNHHQLSAQDVQTAKKTSELFKSNIFKLQIDELLKEVQVKHKHVEEMRHCLNIFYNSMQELHNKTDLSLPEAIATVGEGNIPFPGPQPSFSTKQRFGFMKPSSINVVGSFAADTITKQPESIAVDLFVEMPSQLFQEKDYLNYRYFHKRAFYVAYLAKLLSRRFKEASFETVFHNGNILKPVICITGGPVPPKFLIYIVPGASSEWLSIKKLGADRNCIRIRDSEESLSIPTTRYNASLLSDLSIQSHHHLIQKSRKACPEFTNACKLGRIWLRQRGFSSSLSSGAFGLFEWTICVAALLQGSKILMNGYSSFQIFKSTILFMASGKQGVVFNDNGSRVTKDGNFQIMDEKLGFDILYNMPAWSKQLLALEAKKTAQLLNDDVYDRFSNIFLENIDKDKRSRFDLNFFIRLPQEDPTYGPEAHVRYPDSQMYTLDRLHRVISKAYGDRCVAMLLSRPQDSAREVEISLILNPHACNQPITYGPTSDQDEEVVAFGNFWGSLSETRRFADGTIQEVVTWSGDRSVPRQIAEAVIPVQMQAEVLFPTSQINSFLTCDSNDETDLSLFREMLVSFSKATSMLQEIPELPLRILTIRPKSEQLRYSSINPPAAFDLSNGMAEAVIQFESSQKWPADIFALEKTKSAFLLHIDRHIQENTKTSQYKSAVGLETVVGGVESSFLRLLTPEGYCFKYIVKTEYDLPLLKQTFEGFSDEDYLENFDTSHSSMIQTLALRYPFYSPTVRLLKKWFASQMMSNLVRPEAIELLALKPFLDQGPYCEPSSSLSAFYRVLRFLAGWNWREDPLVLDLRAHSTKEVDEGNQINSTKTSVVSNAMTVSEYQNLVSNFTNCKTALFFIATELDPSGTLWTKLNHTNSQSQLTPMIAGRITTLSRLATLAESSLKSAFTASLSDYDIVIKLHRSSKDSTKKQKKVYKNLGQQFSSDPNTITEQLVNFENAFAIDVSRRFADSTIFFQGDGIICGLWHRDILEPKPFKVHLKYSFSPVDSKSQLVILNKAGILEEIRLLGGNLVEEITSK